jgi:chromate transporter
MSDLGKLIAVFSFLSLLTVGGGMAAFPEMQTLVVDRFHWMTSAQLVHIYSVGQMGPGPNMMMVVGIGQWVAKLPGAILVTVAFFGPTALFAFGIGRVWKRIEKWPWRESIQKGLAPVSVGLLLAGSFTMARVAITGAETAAIAFIVLMVLQRFKVNPALLVAAAAVVGLATF